MFRQFMRNERGSASRWFAVTAVAITLAAVVAAQGFSWMSQSGRMPVIALAPFKRAPNAAEASAAAAGIDMTPIGVIKPSPAPKAAR